MSLIGIPFWQSAMLPASAEVLFTCPAKTAARPSAVTVRNISGWGCRVSFWLVPRGAKGHAVDGNSIVSLDLPAGAESRVPALEGQWMNEGDAIWAQAGAATSIVTFGSGYQNS